MASITINGVSYNVTLTPADVLSVFSTAGAVNKTADKFLLQGFNSLTQSNIAIMVDAEAVKAYLTDGLVTVVDGKIVIDGDTPQELELPLPAFQAGDDGIEVSVDDGETWITVASYEDLGIAVTEAQLDDLFPLPGNDSSSESDSSSE